MSVLTNAMASSVDLFRITCSSRAARSNADAISEVVKLNATRCSLKDRQVAELSVLEVDGLQGLQAMAHLDIVVGLAMRARGPSYEHNLRRSMRRKEERNTQKSNEDAFDRQLAEHYAIMSCSTLDEGTAELCRKCFEPIYGLQCWKLMWIRHKLSKPPFS